MGWKGQPFGWKQPIPYLTFLPESQDATINLLKQIDEMIANGKELGRRLDVQINWLESPSVHLATELFFASRQLDIKFNCQYDEVPQPDPRQSQSRLQLWSYNHHHAKVVPARPPEDMIEGIAKLASLPYDYDANWQKAAQLTGRLSLESRMRLLAVMVHPPQVQGNVPAWVWLQRVQLAAAQCVAQLESRHQVAIEQSVLLEIIRGPIDWIVEAAVIAVTQRARAEDSDAGLIPHFTQLVQRLPEQGHQPLRKATFHNLLLLPHLPEPVQHEIEETLQYLYAQE